jgi:hypothetical protein
MRIGALLIIWSLPFLQSGGQEQSLPTGFTHTAHAEDLVTADVIQRANDDSLPRDPITGILGRSLAEEDDSLEDGSVETSLAADSQWHAMGRDNLSSLAPLQHALLRTPSRPHPLRC